MTGEPDIKAVIAEILESIVELSSPEKIERVGYFFSTDQKVYGVSNPEMKLIVREIRKAYPSWTPEEWISLAKELVRTGIYECQFVGFQLVSEIRKVLAAMDYKDARDLMLGLDNWASVDHFSVGIFGVLWGRGVVLDEHIDTLLASEDVWMRRVGVVSSVALNTASRGGKGDTARTIHVCSRVVDERHPMIWKALSWALRSLVRWDRNAVYAFLSEKQERLSKQVLREVSHKLEHGTKN